MWVPDDSSDSALYEEPPPEILAVQHYYARKLGCDYVLFDQDAPVDSALPTWDW